MKLQDQLDEITTKTRSLVQPERLAASEREIADLFSSGIESEILGVGERAPAFALPDAANRIVRSSDLLALGPLIVNFFRGRWCPYCVTELEAWRDLSSAVRKRGALLIGISPQTTRQNDFLAIQHSLELPLLSDAGCRVATEFGLTFTVSAAFQQYYRRILVNIPLMNGDESWQLPLPATYVIAPDSTILHAAGYADFRTRPDPFEVLESLRPEIRTAAPRPSPANTGQQTQD